jgi:hypothetical protein
LAAPPSTIPAAPTKRSKPVLTLVLGGAVAVALLFGGGFAVGRATAPDSSPFGGSGSARMRSGAGGASAFPLPDGAEPGSGSGLSGRSRFGTSGEITAIDGQTITVTGQDGSATTVTTSADTTVTTLEDGTLADLAVGDTVTVTPSGDTADDGSVPAQSITKGLSQMLSRGGPAGAGPGGAPTPQP